MRLKDVLAVVVGLFVISLTPAAQAQDQQPMESGVKTKGLVTSLGGYRQVDNIPIVLTGMTVEIAPGGQTGRERYLVPTYIYVLDGTLTTDTQREMFIVLTIQSP